MTAATLYCPEFDEEQARLDALVDYIIERGTWKGDRVDDELKLHCLLYYAYSVHAYRYGEELFESPIYPADWGPRVGWVEPTL